MKQSILIKNANIVNEGKIFTSDVFINKAVIEQIGTVTISNAVDLKIIDGKGKYLFPGVIDAHVHFREPGLTFKGDMYTESKAAIAGGITSFLDMPNTIPNVLSQVSLDEKIEIAGRHSLANYSFFMGINDESIERILKLNNVKSCGLSDDGLYLTKKGNLLSDNPEVMEKLFSSSRAIIAIHSENEIIIERNEALFRKKYGENIPVKYHPLIRSEEACFQSTQTAIELAKKHNARLHVLHLSTKSEAELFQNNIPLKEKNITSEVSVNHLWFSDKDYSRLGTLIKVNPAIKTERDRKGLLQALLDDKIDIITTDHSPHMIEEKRNSYFLSPSGAPMVQHSLTIMLELYHQGLLSLEKIAEKMCHNVALLYHIANRGYIREGYIADVTLVDLNSPWQVSNENILYKCGWSPLEGEVFQSRVTHTIINGNLIYENGRIYEGLGGQLLTFYPSAEKTFIL